MRVALVMRSLALLACATVGSACGTDKDALSCAEIGRRLGELQIIERYGSVSGFMTERERQRKMAPWIERCEDVAPSSAERRCILEASDLSTATACATGLALPRQVEEPVADAPFKTRWGGKLGGPGHDSIDAITFARDGDVIAAGSFDQDLSLGADTLPSSDLERVGVL